MAEPAGPAPTTATSKCSTRARLQWPSAQGGVPERPKGTGCKPVGSAYGGSNPPAPTHSAGKSGRFAAMMTSQRSGFDSEPQWTRRAQPTASAHGLVDSTRGQGDHERGPEMPDVRTRAVDPARRRLDAPGPRERPPGDRILLHEVRVHALASPRQGRVLLAAGRRSRACEKRLTLRPRPLSSVGRAPPW